MDATSHGQVILYQGDSAQVLKGITDVSVDSVVCDPPAGIGMLGLAWDKASEGRDAWIAWLSGILREARRCVRPGGYMLCWALPKTIGWTHRAIEDAGWQPTDCIAHINGASYPKGRSCLKPSFEGWILARNPSKGPVDPLQIDACRVAYASPADKPDQAEWNRRGGAGAPSPTFGQAGAGQKAAYSAGLIPVPPGRWPSNVVLQHASSCVLAGERRVKGSRNEKPCDYAGEESYTGLHAPGYVRGPRGIGDSDNLETVAVWECEPDTCPIGVLHDQAGESRAGQPNPAIAYGGHLQNDRGNHVYGTGMAPLHKRRPPHGDAGFRTRFFEQFPPDVHEHGGGGDSWFAIAPRAATSSKPHPAKWHAEMGDGALAHATACPFAATEKPTPGDISEKRTGCGVDDGGSRENGVSTTSWNTGGCGSGLTAPSPPATTSTTGTMTPATTGSKISNSSRSGPTTPTTSGCASTIAPNRMERSRGDAGGAVTTSPWATIIPAPGAPIAVTASPAPSSPSGNGGIRTGITSGSEARSERSNSAIPNATWRAPTSAGPTNGSPNRSPAPLDIDPLEQAPADTDTCDESCPIGALDRQAGTSPGTGPSRHNASMGYGGSRVPFTTAGHPGGGSRTRYFTQLPDEPDDPSLPIATEPRFRYVAKPSTCERDAGVRDEHDQPCKSPHKTVKSLAIARWLCRLVTPPGGTVLDPFAGSGSLVIGAALEGFTAIGVEIDPVYARTAHQRSVHWLGADHVRLLVARDAEEDG